MTDEIKDEEDISQLNETIFLGSLAAAMDVSLLQKLGITSVLTVIDRRTYRRILAPILRQNGLRRLFIHCHDEDDAPLLARFPQTCSFIANTKPGEKILIHCHMGVSRSATVAIAYFLQKHNCTFDEAFALTASKRPFICPNNGFRAQLRKWELLIKNKTLLNMADKKKEKEKEKETKSLGVTKNGVFYAPASMASFLGNADVIPPQPCDALIMAFRGNAEWSAAGTASYPLASIVMKQGQCNMHPTPALDPKFPNATVLILSDIEDNHLSIWVTPTRFPKVQIIYLDTFPPSSYFGMGWFNSFPEHVIFRYVVPDESKTNPEIVPCYHGIQRLITDLCQYKTKTQRAAIQARFEIVSELHMTKTINQVK